VATSSWRELIGSLEEVRAVEGHHGERSGCFVEMASLRPLEWRIPPTEWTRPPVTGRGDVEVEMERDRRCFCGIAM